MAPDKTKQLVILSILVLGLITGVVLVQQTQILEKQASEEALSAFEVTDSEGNPLICSGDTCETNSLEVEIKVKDLNKLISQ